MSFPINNGPSHVPGIQEAQSMRNNGGGGNLGYFQRKKKDEKKKKDEVDVFELTKDDKDEFVLEIDDTKNESLMKKASDFIKMFKKPRHSL